MRAESKSPFVFRHWYFDDRVVAFIIKNDTLESMNQFADWIVETLKNWKPEKPLLIAYEISSAGMLVTPHNRKRAMDIYDAVPTEGIQGRTAIIIANTPFGRFMKVFANKAMRIQNPDMERKFFTSLEAAVAWLNEFTAREEAKPPRQILTIE